MAVGHYRPGIVGASLAYARDTGTLTVFSIGDSNETNAGGSALYHGTRAAIAITAQNDHGIAYWMHGPHCGNGGQCQTIFSDRTVSSPITINLTGTNYDPYTRSVNTNAGNIYMPDQAIASSQHVGFKGLPRNHAGGQMIDDYDLAAHDVSWWVRYYGDTAQTGSVLQFKVFENDGVSSQNLDVGDAYAIDADDDIHFVKALEMTAGTAVWDTQSYAVSVLTTGSSNNGIAAWGEWYQRFDDVTAGLHVSPLWNLGGGTAQDCKDELVVTTAANDTFLKQRLKDTGILHSGSESITPNAVLRIALGGNEWADQGGTSVAQEAYRFTFETNIKAIVDHFEAVWVECGFDLAKLNIWLEGYHAADGLGQDNDPDYGYRSSLYAIAAARARCTFIDPAAIKSQQEMKDEGLYAGGVGVEWDSHRTPLGYNVITSDAIGLMLAVADSAQSQTLEIHQNSNDGTGSGAGGNTWNENSAAFGLSGGLESSAGFRFVAVNIPQGATIESATFEYENLTIGSTPAGVIHCEDADTSAEFATSDTPANRTVTTAATAAAVTTGVHQADITNAVQEVVDRAGWYSGSNLAVIMRNTSATDPSFVIVVDKSDKDVMPSLTAASLTIEYTYTVPPVEETHRETRNFRARSGGVR